MAFPTHSSRRKFYEALEAEMDQISRVDPQKEGLPKRNCRRCYDGFQPCSGLWVLADKFIGKHIAACAERLYSTPNPSNEVILAEAEKCLQAVRVFLRHPGGTRYCVEYGAAALSEIEHHLTCILLLYPFQDVATDPTAPVSPRTGLAPDSDAPAADSAATLVSGEGQSFAQASQQHQSNSHHGHGPLPTPSVKRPAAGGPVPSAWKSQHYVEPTREFWRHAVDQLHLRQPATALSFWENASVMKALAGGFESTDLAAVLRSGAALPPPFATSQLDRSIRPIASPAVLALRLRGRLTEALLLARAADNVQAVLVLLSLGRPRDAYPLCVAHAECCLGNPPTGPTEPSALATVASAAAAAAAVTSGKASSPSAALLEKAAELVQQLETRVRNVCSFLLSTASVCYAREMYAPAVLVAGCVMGPPRRRRLLWPVTPDAAAALVCAGLPTRLHTSVRASLLASIAHRAGLPRLCVRHRPLPTLTQLCCEKVAAGLPDPDHPRAPEAYAKVEGRLKAPLVQRVMRLSAARFAADVGQTVVSGALGRWFDRRGLHREALCVLRALPLYDAYAGRMLLTVAAGARNVDTVARRLEPLDKDAALRLAHRAKALKRPGAALHILLQSRAPDGALPLSLAAYAARQLAAELSEDELAELNATLDALAPRVCLLLRFVASALALKSAKAPTAAFHMLLAACKQTAPVPSLVLPFVEEGAALVKPPPGVPAAPPTPPGMARAAVRSHCKTWREARAAKSSPAGTAVPSSGGAAAGKRGSSGATAASASAAGAAAAAAATGPAGGGDGAGWDSGSEADDEESTVVRETADVFLDSDLRFLQEGGLGAPLSDHDVALSEKRCDCGVCSLDPYAAEAAEQRIATRYLLMDREDLLEAAVACRPLPAIPWGRLVAQCCDRSQFQAALQLTTWSFYFDPCAATLAQCQQLFSRCYPSGNWAERRARLLQPLLSGPPLYNFVGAAELLRGSGHAEAVQRFAIDLDEDERAAVKARTEPSGGAAAAAAAGSAAAATAAAGTASVSGGASAPTAASHAPPQGKRKSRR